MLENQYQPGRPSVVESMLIDKTLRLHYLKTYSIEFTAEITGRHRRTVKKRFDNWDIKSMRKLNDEFDKGDSAHKEEYVRLNQSLIDKALFRLDQLAIDIDNARKSGSESYSNLIVIENQIMRTLEVLGEKRCAVKISPGAERVVGKVIEDRVEKYAKSG